MCDINGVSFNKDRGVYLGSFTLFNYSPAANFGQSNCQLFNATIAPTDVQKTTDNYCGFSTKSSLFPYCKQATIPPPVANTIIATPTSTVSSDSSNSNSTNVGLIIGLIVAVVLLIFILLAVFFYHYRSNNKPKPEQMSSQTTLHDHSKNTDNQYLMNSQPTIYQISSSNQGYSYNNSFDQRQSSSMVSHSQDFNPLELRSSQLKSNLDTNYHATELNRNKTYSPMDSFQPLELPFLERNKTYAPTSTNEEFQFPRYSLEENAKGTERVDSFGRVNTLQNDGIVPDTLSKTTTLKQKDTLVTRASNPDTPILQQNFPDEPVADGEEDKHPRYQIQ
ncbi:hypothetical protein HK103_003485 [Boothiomyces macroporosus]|uniref:Uncharacterized protein n=1 Tax=Boothiomyces macroporosus TaxID=261099 RepID=A0AAD5U8Q0_9FUNG|nr:hypothetical protein HK103_003485 [Boothiomyces macroporosus]